MWPTFEQQNPNRHRIARVLSRGTSHPGLTLSTESGPDGIVMVRVTGEVDLCTASVLGAHVDEVLQNRCTTVVIDLSGVEFLGVAGLRALLATRSEALAAGVDLRLASCSYPVRRALEVSGLADTFPIYPELLDPVTADVVPHRSPKISPRGAPVMFGGA